MNDLEFIAGDDGLSLRIKTNETKIDIPSVLWEQSQDKILDKINLARKIYQGRFKETIEIDDTTLEVEINDGWVMYVAILLNRPMEGELVTMPSIFRFDSV